MAHITFDHDTHHRPGTSRFGEIGFYSALGIVVVGLLILFGIYEVTQQALAGVASMFSGV